MLGMKLDYLAPDGRRLGGWDKQDQWGTGQSTAAPWRSQAHPRGQGGQVRFRDQGPLPHRGDQDDRRHGPDRRFRRRRDLDRAGCAEEVTGWVTLIEAYCGQLVADRKQVPELEHPVGGAGDERAVGAEGDAAMFASWAFQRPGGGSSRRRITLSSPPEARVRPSRLMTTARTVPSWPFHAVLDLSGPPAVRCRPGADETTAVRRAMARRPRCSAGLPDRRSRSTDHPG